MAVNIETRVKNLECSLLFMQQEHADTLKLLHQEIAQLQKRCSDMTFQLAMENTSISQEDVYREKCEKLEKEVKGKCQSERGLSEQCVKKDRIIKLLEQQLKAQEKRYQDQLKLKEQELNKQRVEALAKADHIAYLSNQLLTARRTQKVRACDRPPSSATDDPHTSTHQSSSSSLRRLPTPPTESSKQCHPCHRIYKGTGQFGMPVQTRKSSPIPCIPPAVLNHPPSSRRLSDSSNSEDSIIPDPSPFLQSKPDSDIEIEQSMQANACHRTDKVVLPPIASSKHNACDIPPPQRIDSYAFVRKSTLEHMSSSSEAEVSSLAMEPPVPSRKHSLRKAQQYNSSQHGH